MNMKKILFLLGFCITIQLSVKSQEAFRDLVFSARLDTIQQPHVLSTPSDARGVAGLTLSEDRLYVSVSVNGLTGPILNAHIHDGKPGISGGAVYPLGDFIIGNKIKGFIENIDLSSGELEKFIKGEYYINIHTAANPSGEIRGQITLETDIAFTSVLDRSQAGISITPQNHTVTVNSNFFEPSSLTINTGDTVTYKWMEGNHTITSYATTGEDVWDESSNSGSGDFQLVLTEAGEHAYFCKFHESLGMTGLIHVQDEPSGLGTFSLSQDRSTLEVKVLFSGLNNTVSNAHLHWGREGTSGGPAIGVNNLLEGNTFSGELDLTSLDNKEDFIDSLMNEAIYLNVHTSGYPAGELRGQLKPGASLAFDTWLTAEQQVSGTDDATPGSALGLAVVGINALTDSLWIHVLLDSLSGDVSAAHFHNASTGNNGSPVVNFGTMLQGNEIKGWITNGGPELMGENDFYDIFNKLLDGEIYLNVHTILNPGGELRGQVDGTHRSGVVFDICTGQITGEVSDSGHASGTGLVTIGRKGDNLYYQAAVSDLSSGITAAHFHMGATGEDGGVIFPFETDSVISGYWRDDMLTPDIIADFESKDIYMLFHTTLNPGGELRGQAAYGVPCSIDTTIMDTVIVDTVIVDTIIVDTIIVDTVIMDTTFVDTVLVDTTVSDTTDISDTVTTAIRQVLLDLEIYPNPVSDHMRVILPEPILNEGYIEIRNILGQRVYSRKIFANSAELEIDVGALSKGIYILKLPGNDKHLYVSRFLKE